MAEKKKKIIRKVGRPTRYKAEYAEQARKLCLLGATDIELANFFGISTRTLDVWKKSHPEFVSSIKGGKDIADAEVAEKLFQRALGYSHKAVKIMAVDKCVVREEYIEHYPPDTQAASLWLRNRQPKKWRDKQDVEHSGKDGGPIQSEVTTKVVVVPAKNTAEVEVRAISDEDERS